MADSDSFEEYKSDEEAARNDVIAAERKKAEVANATDEKPGDVASVKTDDVIQIESGEKKKEKKKKKEKQDQDEENKKEKKKEKKTKEGKKEKRAKEPKDSKAEVEKKPEEAKSVAQETTTLPVAEVVIEAVAEAVPVVELSVSPVEIPEVHPETEKTTFASVQPEVPLPEVATESSEKQSTSDVTPEAEPVTSAAATSASKPEPEPEIVEIKTVEQESAAEPETTVTEAVKPPEVTEPDVVVTPEEAPKPDATETSEQAAPSTAPETEQAVPETEISAQPSATSVSADAGIPETQPAAHPVSGPPPPSVRNYETASNLRPGIQEILARAQRVADERASWSSKVLSAKSLISRQEKLQERLVEMRSDFTDFDSEIRALRLDAYRNQQKRLQKH